MNTNEYAKKISFSHRASTEQARFRASNLSAADPSIPQRPSTAFTRHGTRELSDIREVSNSSKDGTIQRNLSRLLDGANEWKFPKSTSQPTSTEGGADAEDFSRASPSRSVRPAHGLDGRATSVVSLPLKSVPERKSSASFLTKDRRTSRQSSVHEIPSWKMPPLSTGGRVIPSRGRSSSPVREALNHDPVSSDATARSPSKTFIRTVPPVGILDLGNIRHGRVDMSLQTPAPLFVGGGTIEGHVLLTVDGGNTRKQKPKPLFVSRLSIDVVGVEEVTDGRRWIYMSLATELFDKDHPPPASLVTTQTITSGTELSWPLKPASTFLPFCMNLPLNVGPPPYASKQARIRYLLCATLHIRRADKLALVRQSFEIPILTVYDPEKALISLSTPLVATDQISIPHGVRTYNIKLTAGLHRQTWVHGAMIFVDVHVMNNNSKTIKKIEVQLEKTTLWYSHAAAGTTERSATHLRLPNKSENELVCASVIKKSKDWNGIPPNTSEVRTCDLEVPRGHVTISTGRYFEVRYFLNVIVTVAMFKTLAVQLPVTIIHINSLDIVPNSLAQVAASIEAKRARTVPVADDAIYPAFSQGQAFTAPRRQSLERMRKRSSELCSDGLDSLTRDLDDSPRRFARPSVHGHKHNPTLSAALSENHPPGRLGPAPSSHHHHTRHNSCYHCHLQEAYFPYPCHHKPSIASMQGRKLPRLQLSTSGLGFSDSEFEIAPDSPPRKVMLSERERRLILQERELRLQRQLSQRYQLQALQKGPSVGRSNTEGGLMKEEIVGPADGYRGWRNVALQPFAMPLSAANHEQGKLRTAPHPPPPGKGSNRRSRSNTVPERLGMNGPALSMKVPMSGQGQGNRRSRRSVDSGRSRDNGGRSKDESAAVGSNIGATVVGKRYRKSVEKW